MAGSSDANLPTRADVQQAHQLIKQYIHETPVLTSTNLDRIASTPQTTDALKDTEWAGETPAKPNIHFFFKCENFQKVGAFKARGAFHATLRLSETQRQKGVITHSSGNHAQALAYAAQTLQIPAHIVMPSNSIKAKIAGVKSYGANLTFSGPTSQEREEKVAEIQSDTGATLIPPYDHEHIIMGQGTAALELEQQVRELLGKEEAQQVNGDGHREHKLDAIITPVGGGGLLSGTATAVEGLGIRVFAAEPSFEGADDARRGLQAGERITHVKSTTVADGLRTPLGVLPYKIISDTNKVHGVYAVTEEQIVKATKLVWERMKVVIEPSGAVGLAAALYNESFRKLLEREGGEKVWNLGVIFSGGNVALDDIASMFAKDTPR